MLTSACATGWEAGVEENECNVLKPAVLIVSSIWSTGRRNEGRDFLCAWFYSTGACLSFQFALLLLWRRRENGLISLLETDDNKTYERNQSSPTSDFSKPVSTTNKQTNKQMRIKTRSRPQECERLTTSFNGLTSWVWLHVTPTTDACKERSMDETKKEQYYKPQQHQSHTTLWLRCSRTFSVLPLKGNTGPKTFTFLLFKQIHVIKGAFMHRHDLRTSTRRR